MQLQPTLDTKIEEFELHQRLHTRLVMCRAKTFRDIMEINPADWKGVNPKVVNALRRFQNQYRNIYRQLMASQEFSKDTAVIPATNASKRKTPKSSNDERRFFVANNILNAYAQAGMLTSGEREIGDMMREIIEAADAFMNEYERDCNTISAPDNVCESTPLTATSEDSYVSDIDEEAYAAETEDIIPNIDHAIDEALDEGEIDEILLEEAAPVVAAAEEAEKIAKSKKAKGSHSNERKDKRSSNKEKEKVDTPHVSDHKKHEEAVDEACAADSDNKAVTEDKNAISEVQETEQTEDTGTTRQDIQKLSQPIAKKGERITLTEYHGRNRSTSKTFKVGDTVTVRSMRRQPSGVIVVKARLNNKEITIDSRRYAWEVIKEEDKYPELNLLEQE